MAAIFSNNIQGATESTQQSVKSDLDSVVTNTNNLTAMKSDLDQIVTNTGNSSPTSSFIHSDTISTVAAGATQDAGAANLVKSYSIVAKGTGAIPTTVSVNLEVSLDSVNWTVLLTVAQTLDGIITSTGDNHFPARYWRANVTALTLGAATNVVVTVAAMK